MELRLSITQLFLCFYNITLFVTGVVVIYQGTQQNPEIVHQTAYKNLEFAHYITIAVGVLWCITGATGLYGILRERLVLVLNACLLGITVLAFLMEKIFYLNSIQLYVTQEMQVAVWHMKENGYNQSEFLYSHPIQDWIESQHDNECCGVYSVYDWLNSTTTGWSGKIPKQCCKVITKNCTDEYFEITYGTQLETVYYEIGCDEKIYEQLLDTMKGTIVLSFVPLIGQMLALICTLWVLMFSSKRNPIHVVPRRSAS